MTIDLKALRETAAREIRRGASGLCPPQTVIALLDRLEAAEKDAAQYRWLRDEQIKEGVALDIAVCTYGDEWGKRIDAARGEQK